MLVSIHALRFQRAMRRGPRGHLAGQDVSIHALRFQRAMHDSGGDQHHELEFQSTPSVSRGRCYSCQSRFVSSTGFNPRPPFPEGDASFLPSVGWLKRSFNPRPPFPEGDANPTIIKWLEHLFQSTPSVSRGRCARFHRPAALNERFNPRPPFPEGDAHLW